MERTTPTLGTPNVRPPRRKALFKRRHSAFLARLLMIGVLIVSTFVWRHAASVVAAPAQGGGLNHHWLTPTPVVVSTIVLPPTSTPATAINTPVSSSGMVLLQVTSVVGGSPAQITTTVADSSGWFQNGIIDMEIYDTANQKIGQQYFTGQSLAPGQAMAHTIMWSPPSGGAYRVKVGVFGADWSPMIMWNDNAASFNISSSGGNNPLLTDTTVPATNTPVAPTETFVPPSNTPIPPTSTSSVSTSTPIPPTSTRAVSTSTPAPPTSTRSVSTSTPAPPTSTRTGSTNTPIPPTATLAPATATKTGNNSNSSSGCRFQLADAPLNVAFCDTFDAPAGIGNRSGGLDGLFWGASRTTQNTNPGQGIYDGWVSTARSACSSPVVPEQDLTICNGQLVEAVNDDHGFTTLAMYPTQPFDIAGRTGTVVFDVGADSEGPHAAWPSFVYTDQPVPAPTGNHTTTAAYAKNSFGFALDADPANCGKANQTGVGEAFATSNYAYRDLSGAFTPVNNCLSHAPGSLNHFEVRISQSRVEIWGTNAGSSTLQELGFIANANLTLTRGLIWMEDQHYNADKFNDQRVHSFLWDNVGFDGPTLARDLHLDVNDALTSAGDGSLNLGWYAPDSTTGTPLILTVPGATNLDRSAAALLTLNFFPTDTSAIEYRLNGNAWHTLAWPFPDNLTYQWRTIAIPVALSELQAGTNTLSLEATKGGATVANVDLVLVGAQGTPSS